MNKLEDMRQGSEASAGIVEWKLLRPQNDPPVDPTEPEETNDPTEPENTNTPDAPEQKESSKGFFARLLDWLRSIIERIKRLFA